MNVREIVKKYLKKNGYDGLYCEACGCYLSDLMPCENNSSDCEPGYAHKCDNPDCWCEGEGGICGQKG